MNIQNTKEKVYAIHGDYNEIERFMEFHRDIARELQEYICPILSNTYFSTMLRLYEKYAEIFIDEFFQKSKELYDERVLEEYFFTFKSGNLHLL